MLHGPAAPSGPDHASGEKMRLGILMFIPYALFYAGFVLITLVWPMLMERPILFGLNLAVVYGFGLIVVAMALALVYNSKCARLERDAYSPADGRGER
jgi:uncharacterized membrane protein (DUF485 family)